MVVVMPPTQIPGYTYEPVHTRESVCVQNTMYYWQAHFTRPCITFTHKVSTKCRYFRRKRVCCERFPAYRNSTRRNATQELLYVTKKCCVLCAQPQTPQRRSRLLAAFRKQIETTSIFPQCRNRPFRAAIAFNQWLRHCGCGTLRYVAESMEHAH